jgi:hypothetical protein
VIVFWRVRISVVVICWLMVVIGMAALQMDPRPVLIAGLAAAVASALWLLIDLADVAEPLSWSASFDPARLPRGADLRIRALQGQLAHGPTVDDGRGLHRLLVDLIDDRLTADHGIDRATEPDRANAALGPTLAAFVAGSPSSRQLRDPSFLSSIITLIESL